MEKNNRLVKKETYVNNENEDDSICIKIDVNSNHLLDKSVVLSIEKQLFDINLIIEGYLLIEDLKETKKADKLAKAEQKKIDKINKVKTKVKVKDLVIKYNGKPI